ncbi:DNA primase/helicase [Gossypium arboreum]|uniref:DNA primase/helicase n=1 Tax=Gossypium arboreum TaxID=29729 RepID=A0A0B0NE59_GOSAR|nr:DNA primase/helicase [Gossypium arboreum]
MLRLPSHNQRFHLLLRNLSSFASKTTIFMASKHFLPSPLLPQTLSPKHFSTPSKRLLPSLSSKPIPKNHSFSLRTNGFCSLPSPSVSSPSPAYSQDLEDQPSDTRSLQILNHKLKQLGIDITECVAGRENRLKCPSCNGGESGELSLSLFISLDGYSASWLCFRAKCGWKGYTKAAADGKPSIENLGRVNKVKVTRQITVESLQLEPLCNQLTAYFAERMISSETLKRNAIMQKRSGDEVEGEMDKLAMEEAGFRNCVSVPDGAPPSVSKKEVPAEEQASRIILATDGDLPGQALAEELARRLGRERCWRVKWPKKNDVDHFKDANEVLMYLGPSVLKDVIDNAELYPIRGLFNFSSFFDEIDQYYHRTLGYEFGVSTGWRALDDLYNVVPGELTIVTGVPNSGKSEWIDALLCNLNEGVGWKFALCSMENKVRDHARKLLEKSIKKPFFGVGYGSNVERMSVEELEKGKKWLSDTFQLIRCENDSLPSIQWVLELARAAVLRHGVQGLVIDPYNELDHQRPVSQTETEYVSQMLTKIKRFAQHHSCHVWFVAHPRQLHHWIGAPPNLYDISGSAHFINKCDNGIVIHRNRDPDAGPVDLVQVCVRKVRNKVVGNIGDAFLSYDRVTGVYNDIDESQKK